MKIKNSILALLITSAVLLSGCSINLSGADLIHPPKTTGNEAEIQKLIEDDAESDYTLKYPNGMAWYRKQSYYVPANMTFLYDANDVRRTYLLWKGSKTDNVNDLTTMKYSGGQYDDVLYMRLAEVKLTYAELLARTSGSITSEALQQLNDVRLRAIPENARPEAYKANDFANVDAFIKEVLRERNRELAYEGHYRWDLMRTDNALGDATLGAVAKNRWNLAVPNYEIRISYGAIKQNTGYQN